MRFTINFDMDGTIANLYGVNDWLNRLRAEDSTPYTEAKPLIPLAHLARAIHKAQKRGIAVAVISWTSKGGSKAYDEAVAEAKREWLRKHLPSVDFDEIHIVPYGTPKQMFCKSLADVLFDDEQKNRTEWTGRAYDVDNILEILRNL